MKISGLIPPFSIQEVQTVHIQGMQRLDLILECLDMPRYA